MTFLTYGFSGALFDEVRLRAVRPGATCEAAALDAIKLGNFTVVPDPATAPLLLAGLGLFGLILQFRDRSTVK